MLHFSAMIFFTNAFHALNKSFLFYGLAFAALALTSYFHHKRPVKSAVLFWLDQLAVWAVISIGGVHFFSAPLSAQLIIFPTVLSVAILYWHGKRTQTLCFDPRKHVATLSHVGMHLLASLGHHGVLLALE
jgi:hypothetical protein